MRTAKPRLITCGTLVTDGQLLLVGHATGSPRWDIPKGLLEPGEHARQAAVRELREEVGLDAPAEQLVELGRHAYRSGKDLVLFAWPVAVMPDPARLHCGSTFVDRFGRTRPEFDQFAVLPWAEALMRMGASLRAVLGRVGAPGMWGEAAGLPPA
jgi:8-oxo-dGTP pyrophosphatase MutT (NUDIX family)